jgi:hypothetical protein
MKKVFIILVIALVVFVIYYLVSSVGVIRWPVLPSYFSPVGSSGLSYTPSPSSAPSPTPSSPPAPSPTPTPAPAPVPPPPAGFTQGDLSPFYGKVTLSYVSRPSYYVGGGVISVRADGQLGDPVDVTGWKVKGNKGEVNLSGAPAPGGPDPINQTTLLLRPGDELIAYGGYINYRLPVLNVRLNKCTGYLNDRYNLNPRVPENCPRYTRDEFATFTGACQNYLYSLRSCGTPPPEKINELSYDAACRAFLDTLNYDGCYRRHRSDGDFLQGGWRVWLPSAIPFSVDHDRILLLDWQGLLVSQYVY